MANTDGRMAKTVHKNRLPQEIRNNVYTHLCIQDFHITIGDPHNFDLRDDLSYAYGTSDVKSDSRLMGSKLLSNEMAIEVAEIYYSLKSCSVNENLKRFRVQEAKVLAILTRAQCVNKL